MAESPLVKATLLVCGIVQGVGFRPFVARLAKAHGVVGTVRNTSGQVEINAFGTRAEVSRFLTALREKRPAASFISQLREQWTPMDDETSLPCDFSILESEESDCPALPMPSPDLPVCEDCLREIDTKGDPRFQNPFISCTHCGPRFSIMRRLPYDRHTTAMAAFPLCPLCQEQYTDSDDRRHHAQTVCCNHCGPNLRYTGRQEALDGHAAFLAAVSALQSGGIVAIKGIGGYHFACSPFLANSVAQLRKLKGREHKPFAVMCENLVSLREYCQVSEAEKRLLTSSPRPIVLLRRKASPITETVYGASTNLGAFLPYTPLQHLLLRQTGPLVMTSANVSSLPMMKDEEEILPFFAQHSALSGVLHHDRAIVRRLDDSVALVAAGQESLIRRARGYVPLPIPVHGPALTDAPNGATDPAAKAVLACGGQEKSTICLLKDGYAYLSAEMGDLDGQENQAVYSDTAADMESLLGIAPSLVVRDLHPDYASTEYALAQSPESLPVQHHHAHIASVMAEHGLTAPVLGVAFDGTGYGTDGALWGGEFLIATPTSFTRVACMKPVPMLGGDASIRQGWKSAACLLWNAGMELAADERFSLVKAALTHGVNTYLSSSMGRIFDAVSSLLGICDESQYGGQGAMELEQAATRYLLEGGTKEALPLPYALSTPDESECLQLDLSPCLRQIQELRQTGEGACELAWRFHQTLVQATAEICLRLSKQFGLHTVALSGGVFVNRLLLEGLVPLLTEAGLTVYRNHLVPAGDGGLSLGQAYIGLWTQKEAIDSCASRCQEN